MRILQVIPYFFVDWAGGRKGKPVESVYGLSKALVNRGHKVIVYTTDSFNKTNESSNSTSLGLNGIEICEFKSLGKRGGIFNLRISPAMIPILKKDLQVFDIIHLHEYPTFQNCIVHHYAKKYHIPYVLQAHGSFLKFEAKGFKWLLRFLYDISIGQRLIRDASRIIAASYIEAEQYIDMGIDKKKIEIIPYGLDLAEYGKLPCEGKFRMKWSIDDNQKMVLFLARINIIKRPDLLAKAFAKLSNEIDNTVLVIAGPDDGYLPTLKNLVTELGIDEKVIFTGPLYGTEKVEAFIDADVYVLPSSYEAFGITVIEAYACGTPVIVAVKCGMANEVENKTGFVIPYDENALMKAIQDLLNGDDLRDKFGQNGKLLIREKYNWPKVAETIENLYRNILFE